jgi:hypothetical protein
MAAVTLSIHHCSYVVDDRPSYMMQIIVADDAFVIHVLPCVYLFIYSSVILLCSGRLGSALATVISMLRVCVPRYLSGLGARLRCLWRGGKMRFGER